MRTSALIALTLPLAAAEPQAAGHDLVLENMALRQQLRVLQRTARPRFCARDRLFWVLLARWRSWRSAWSSYNPRPSSAGIVTGSVDGGRGAPDATAQGVHHWIPTFEH